jgi:hypothetical protein
MALISGRVEKGPTRPSTVLSLIAENPKTLKNFPRRKLFRSFGFRLESPMSVQPHQTLRQKNPCQAWRAWQGSYQVNLVVASRAIEAIGSD